MPNTTTAPEARTIRQQVPRRAARYPYSADAALWVEWCDAAGARLDAPGRSADAVAFCATGRASAFALPSKLRDLDARGVDRTLGRIDAGEIHPALRVHICHVGEGTGTPRALACDVAGLVGHLGDHHARWIAALPARSRALLRVVVLRPTGGQYGHRSRGLNVAVCGIGPAVRLARTLPPPALPPTLTREPATWYRTVRPPRQPVAFPLGHVVATPAALDSGADLLALLARHSAGDWGDVDAGDASLNDEALDLGGRLVSSYETPAGVLWVITEADRSATTVLLPEDY